MPIDFTCPHCGERTKVSDEYAGRSGPCARCGKTIAIPPLARGALNLAAERRRSIARAALVALLCAAIIFICAKFVLLPLVEETQEANRQTACSENLRRIGQALLMYRAKYGGFPPACTTDSQGRPMHSWRVLILPYLDETALYQQYNLREPWNGRRNLALAERMPSVFRCPSDVPQGAGGNTSYVAITGQGTAFDGVKPENFPYGPGETVLVVERSGSGINWLEPRDLNVNKMSLKVNDPQIDDAIRSEHRGGANVLTCDGQARFMSESISPEQLVFMLSISGGEKAWITPEERAEMFKPREDK
jgi:prepilin-type processing-associated H-X9-DG protein